MSELTISRLLPFSQSKKCCFIVRLSNNVLEMAPKLDKIGLNLIIAVVCSLQKSLTKGVITDYSSYTETDIEIPRKYVSLRNVSDVTSSLMYLLEFAFIFHRTIPGYTESGFTRLLSGVKCVNGHVIVTVPGQTIPWFIYCGVNVNYLVIEQSVFFGLKTLPDKLLYLFLMSKVDQKQSLTFVTVGARELNTILGVKSTRPISSLIQKYLKNYSNKLQEAGSKYQISYELSSQKGYREKTGRKPISNIMFIIHNTKMESGNTQDVLAELAERLTRLWKKHGPKKIISVVWLIQQVEATGRINEFISKMTRISHKNEKENNFAKLANTAAKIARQDFGINI